MDLASLSCLFIRKVSDLAEIFKINIRRVKKRQDKDHMTIYRDDVSLAAGSVVLKWLKKEGDFWGLGGILIIFAQRQCMVVTVLTVIGANENISD